MRALDDCWNIGDEDPLEDARCIAATAVKKGFDVESVSYDDQLIAALWAVERQHRMRFSVAFIWVTSYMKAVKS